MNQLAEVIVTDGGSGRGLISALVWLICLGLVFYLLWWLVSYINPPEPFGKVARVILAVAAVLILISFIMSFAGYPVLVRW